MRDSDKMLLRYATKEEISIYEDAVYELTKSYLDDLETIILCGLNDEFSIPSAVFIDTTDIHIAIKADPLCRSIINLHINDDRWDDEIMTFATSTVKNSIKELVIRVGEDGYIICRKDGLFKLCL